MLLKKRRCPAPLLLSLTVFFFSGFHSQTSSAKDADTLSIARVKAGFLSPPDAARPGVYWYFMDGNQSRESMTADLESMKKAGIGNLVFLGNKSTIISKLKSPIYGLTG